MYVLAYHVRQKMLHFAIALSKLHLSWQFSAHNNFNKFAVICNRYFSYKRIRRTSLSLISRAGQRTVHAVAQPSRSSVTRRRTSTIAPNLWLPSISDFYYTVSRKNIPDVFSYNSRKHWRIFIIFGRNVTKKASNHMLLYPPHLISASTLPCETENTEIVSFHINAACWFASRHTSHIGFITYEGRSKSS